MLFRSMRVYLKERSFLEEVRMVMMEKYAHLSVIYLFADVCREELLVEIEGLSRISVL